MKSLTLKIKIPREIRTLLSDHYTDKDLRLEITEEIRDFLWDIYHGLKKAESIKGKIEKPKSRAA